MSTTDTQWMSASERSSVWAIRLMVWLSLILGRRPSRIILLGIAGYFLLGNTAARKASRQYLQRVLGREPRLRECYRHFFTFASVIHDRIYLLKDKFDLLDIEIFGLPALMEAVQEKAPVMLLGAHLGSFELLRATGKLQGVDVAMLMYVENARKINAVLESINPDATRDIIHLKNIGSMLQAKTAIDDGRLLGMLADRGLGAGKVASYDFLGAPAAFPHNPFRLAALLGCRVFFMSGLYLGGNRYEAHIIHLGDFPSSDNMGDDMGGGNGKNSRAQQQALLSQMEAAYVAQLSRLCHYAPYNWFNFYDFWQTDKASPDSVHSG
jgi:predicted LPLAT superfamily acyltransferase